MYFRGLHPLPPCTTWASVIIWIGTSNATLLFKYILRRAIYFFSRVSGIRNLCPSANCEPFQSFSRRRHLFNRDANASHLAANVDKCWGRCRGGLLTVAARAMHTKYARQQDGMCPPHPSSSWLLPFFGFLLNAVASLLKLHSHSFPWHHRGKGWNSP